MSLGKLLTAGKSLVGLHNSAARYELRTGALPKFGPKKNPFVAPPNSEEPSSEPELPRMTAAEAAAASLKDTQRLPLLTPEPQTIEEISQPAGPEKQELPSAPVEVPSAINGWLKKLNPLVWWEHRKPEQPKSAIPRFDKAPVQGELSLDNIKVVRNDLSDADVEIVPMKARIPNADSAPMSGAGTGAAAAMAIPDLPPAKNAWEFLGERLLGKH